MKISVTAYLIDHSCRLNFERQAEKNVTHTDQEATDKYKCLQYQGTLKSSNDCNEE